MKKRYLWVGILVTVAILLFATGLFLIGNQHKAFRRHTDFYAEFTNVDGIAKGAKIRVNALGGEKAQGTQVRKMVEMVAQNVEGGLIGDCGHFIPEESPDDVVRYVLAMTNKATKQ